MFKKIIVVIIFMFLFACLKKVPDPSTAKTPQEIVNEVWKKIEKEKEDKAKMTAFIMQSNPRIFVELAVSLTNLIYSISDETFINPEFIVYIMKIESDFNIFAVSNKGAIGLMQINTGVWLDPNNKKNLIDLGLVPAENSIRQLFNPEINIRSGVFILELYAAQCNKKNNILNEKSFQNIIECTAKKYFGISKKKNPKSNKYYEKLLEIMLKYDEFKNKNKLIIF